MSKCREDGRNTGGREAGIWEERKKETVPVDSDLHELS